MQETCHGIHKYTKCDKEGVPLLVQEILKGALYFHIIYFDNSTATIRIQDVRKKLPYNFPEHLIEESIYEEILVLAKERWTPTVW